MNRRPLAVVAATIFAVLLLLFLYSIAEILLLLFIAILFAVYLGAVTDILQRRLGFPRPLGLIAALILTIIGVTGIGALMVPALIQQTESLVAAMPETISRWDEQLRDLAARSGFLAQLLGPLPEGESYVGGFIGQIDQTVRGAVPFVFSGVQFAIHLISVLVMGIYFTLRPGMYREGLIVLFPPLHRELVRDIVAELGTVLRAWIGGQMLAMIVLGVLTWIGLELLRVPYALAFGVFTGAAAIVPFFGTLVSTLLPALFVLGGAASLVKALAVVALGVIVHLVEANFVAPMIMQRQVNLPPVLSILSVLVMAHLLHVVGLFVAVPVLATTMVIVRRVYVHRLLEGKGFRRAVRDRRVEIRLPSDGSVLVHPVAYERTVPTLLEK
jgi:predicted PurR-regulated permease PerM